MKKSNLYVTRKPKMSTMQQYRTIRNRQPRKHLLHTMWTNNRNPLPIRSRTQNQNTNRHTNRKPTTKTNGEMEKMQENNIIGNSTTILNTLILMIVGIIFGKYGATLLQFGITETILTEIITFIILTIFAYINAKYHNTLFPTTPNKTLETEEQVLNDEYETTEDNDDGC